MLVYNNKKSHIIISKDIELQNEKLIQELKPNRVVSFIRENFLIEDAKAVVAEAYKSEAEVKYIVLGALSFTSISQNSLLKVLEEPPKNIEFIIISSTKSGLLPTIRSRLPIVKDDTKSQKIQLEINMGRLDSLEVFEFLKQNARIQKSEAKALVEALYYRASVIDKLILSSTQLENFDMAYRLLELNSRPQNVLAMLMMSFIKSGR